MFDLKTNPNFVKSISLYGSGHEDLTVITKKYLLNVKYIHFSMTLQSNNYIWWKFAVSQRAWKSL